MGKAIVLSVLLVLVLGVSGCADMNRGERTAAGAGLGAVGGAGLGAAFGALAGVPGTGALWGGLGGAIVGSLVGVFTGDDDAEVKTKEAARKLSALKFMTYEQLEVALATYGMPQKAQTDLLNDAMKQKLIAEKDGMVAEFYFTSDGFIHTHYSQPAVSKAGS